MSNPLQFQSPTISPQFAPQQQPDISGQLGELARLLLAVRGQQQSEQQFAANRQNQAFDNLTALLNTLGPQAAQEPALEPLFQQAGVPRKPLAEAQVAERRQLETEQAEFLKTLPPELARAQSAAFAVLRQGGGREQAADIAATLGETTVSPKTVATIDAEFPELADLPMRAKVQAFTQLRQMQVQARLGLGPEGRAEAQRRLTALRVETQGLRNRLLRKQLAEVDDDTLRSALAYLGVIDRALGDLVLLSTRNLVGKPPREQVEALFGKQGLKAYENAVSFLQRQIPAPPPER